MTTEPYDVSNDQDQIAAFWSEVDQRESELIGRLHDEHAVFDVDQIHDAVYDGDDAA